MSSIFCERDESGEHLSPFHFIHFFSSTSIFLFLASPCTPRLFVFLEKETGPSRDNPRNNNDNNKKNKTNDETPHENCPKRREETSRSPQSRPSIFLAVCAVRDETSQIRRIPLVVWTQPSGSDENQKLISSGTVDFQ